MLSEVNIAGVYVPPFLAYACAAAPIFLLLRAFLARTGLLRWLWYPALFEFALSLSIVGFLILCL
jgi:protein AaeX